MEKASEDGFRAHRIWGMVLNLSSVAFVNFPHAPQSMRTDKVSLMQRLCLETILQRKIA